MGKKNIFSKGKQFIPLIPRVNIPETDKRYISTLDIINNKTNDFKSIAKQVLSLPETKQHFREIDFGFRQDSFRSVNFMETALNAIEFVIEIQIGEEYRLRKNLIEIENTFAELTTENLTTDQKAILSEFEQIKQDSILANARVNSEEITLSGLQSEAKILESEKSLRALKRTSIQDQKSLAEIRNLDYPIFAEDIVKISTHQQLKENPELVGTLLKDLKRDISRIHSAKTINGNRVTKKAPVNGKPKKPEPYSLSKIQLNENQ